MRIGLRTCLVGAFILATAALLFGCGSPSAISTSPPANTAPPSAIQAFTPNLAVVLDCKRPQLRFYSLEPNGAHPLSEVHGAFEVDHNITLLSNRPTCYTSISPSAGNLLSTLQPVGDQQWMLRRAGPTDHCLCSQPRSIAYAFIQVGNGAGGYHLTDQAGRFLRLPPGLN